MSLLSVMRMSLRPLPSGTSSVRRPAAKPPLPISGVISSTWRPLTCTRITLIGSRTASTSIFTSARPERRLVPAAGDTMRNFGTGRASRSTSLKVVPGDSRMACSAEARMMAFSTMSGRFRCVRS